MSCAYRKSSYLVEQMDPTGTLEHQGEPVYRLPRTFLRFLITNQHQTLDYG